MREAVQEAHDEIELYRVLADSQAANAITKAMNLLNAYARERTFGE